MIFDTAVQTKIDRMPITTVVAVPTLNESKHIVNVLSSLLNDDRSDEIQVWLVDGGSTDGTVELVERDFQDRVRILNNPKRIQSAAVNLASKKASEIPGVTVLVRADAHCRYPKNFVSGLLQTLEAEKVESVVVPMLTSGTSGVQKDASILFNSWLGNGGSPHRTGKFRGIVEHGHHAAFRLQPFLNAGGYDERFAANEDAELDIRLNALGYRIFLENKLAIEYFPRSTFGSFWRQMLRNGKYRIWTSVKHSQPLQMRQRIPIFIVPYLVFTALLAIVLHPIFWVGFLMYFIVIFLIAAIACRRDSPFRLLWRSSRVAFLAVTCHVGFSIGACLSLIRFFVTKPSARIELQRSVSGTAS